MATKGFILPQNRSYEDTFKFLVWQQFPAILETSVRYNMHLPAVGVYRHVNEGVKNFKSALLDTLGREYVLSGIGSLIDYDRYGHQIRRPTPYLSGTGCMGNSLCIEPTCFGFTEGLIESNNMLNNMCWTLSMPCLKDIFYSDAQFENKMRQYFKMFFSQPPAVLEAYQRTRLLKESIKVVCTDKNFRFTGSVFGGAQGIPLPFYIDPNDALAFPDLDSISAGVGGANLVAFANYVAPRIFSGAFGGGMQNVKMYGLSQDFMNAKEQTASVQDSYMTQELIRALALRGASTGVDRIDAMLGTFIHDPLFPTFKAGTGNVIEPVVADVLEPSTIYGYVQTSNPEHALAPYRAILMVPENWRFNLVEPPRDDFSDIGLGEGLNFRTNTPGVFPIMSSSMFTGSTIGNGGTVIIGQGVDPANGMVGATVRGLVPRGQALNEAVRTEVIQTYSEFTCDPAVEGQYQNVGRPAVPQHRADGFALKSTMYVGSDVSGTARPVLLIFKTDQPRSAKPIVVCDVEEVSVTATATGGIVGCCPGNQTYAILTFSTDQTDNFEVDDLAVYRTGPNGATYLVKVTAVSEKVVSIASVDADGEDAYTLLPCCAGVPDDYGVRGELIKTTGATATSSEIMKAQFDEDTETLLVEFYTPLDNKADGADATITLENGDVILVQLAAASTEGVFAELELRGGETCDLGELDCGCLVNAVFAYV